MLKFQLKLVINSLCILHLGITPKQQQIILLPIMKTFQQINIIPLTMTCLNLMQTNMALEFLSHIFLQKHIFGNLELKM
jgi:hypothetical protein